MKKLVLMASLGLGLTACGESVPGADAPLGRPPVVMIVFDALDSEHISHLGYPRKTTPNMDLFAAEGISFKHAFSPAPYTLAAIASLVTGRLPDSHGLVTKKFRLDDSETTIAELLGGAGYPNMAVVGNPNAGTVFNDMQGFDKVVHTYETSPTRPENYTPPSIGKPIHLSQPEDVLTELVPFLDGLADPDAPFYFYSHVLQPHSPYTPPDDLRGMWLDPEYDGPYLGGHNKQLIAQKQKRLSITDADIAATTALYDANLFWADRALGQIFDELKSRGLYEKSLIIITSDHGEAMWQHGIWGHNDTLFDEMVQVPLIVRLPGKAGDDAPRDLILEQQASTMDILPSIAQWLDLSPPQNLDGVSLVPLIDSLGTESTPRVLRLRDHSLPPSVSLRSPETKAIIHRGRKDLQKNKTPDEFYYFDLNESPGELVQPPDPKDPRAMAARMLLREEAKRIANAKANGNRSNISAKDADILSALGYADGEEPEKEPAPKPKEETDAQSKGSKQQ